MTFDELLTQMKAQARPDDVLVPVLDPTLLLFAAVWPRVPIERTGEEPQGDSWAALWQCVRVDTEALAQLADVPLPKAKQVLGRLQALRLVYPDGGVPDLVRQLIKKRVTEALKQDVR